jgi:hypothetical protein
MQRKPIGFYWKCASRNKIEVLYEDSSLANIFIIFFHYNTLEVGILAFQKNKNKI